MTYANSATKRPARRRSTPDRLDTVSLAPRTQQLLLDAEARVQQSRACVELSESMTRLSLSALASYAVQHTDFKYTALGVVDAPDDVLLYLRIEPLATARTGARAA